MPTDRANQLAKAVRDLPGPIYIHCHHGKHRSPTAAAVACVAAGLLEPAAAETILKTAGTSPGYRGLYQSARDAQPLTPDEPNNTPADFPETAAIPPMAEAMVAIEHKHDALKQIATANWKAPPDHPDLDPAHEALLLREEFEELLRTPEVASKPPAFAQMLRDSHSATLELEQALATQATADQLATPSIASPQTALSATKNSATYRLVKRRANVKTKTRAVPYTHTRQPAARRQTPTRFAPAATDANPRAAA